MSQVIDPRVAQLYRDCRDLATYISKARREIAQMRPDELKTEKLPRAGKELEAIVQATEEATHTIMTAAEDIMSADRAQPDAYQETVEGACMRIFEACSFQDITGQRITKVVKTLRHIEAKVVALVRAFGHDVEASPEAAKLSATDEEDDLSLLNGPQMPDKANSQDDIDALLASFD